MKIQYSIRYYILILISIPVVLFAKSPKPKILVYGSTLDAYVAALQSSASGVPTLWINPNSYTFIGDKSKLSTSDNILLNGGVITQFINNDNKTSDSLKNFLNPGNISTNSFYSESNPLLTVLSAEDIIKIEYKKSWKFTLSNKKSYDVQVVLDASKGNALATKAKLSDFAKPIFKRTKDLGLEESRNIVLVGEYNNEIFVAGLPDLMTQKNNFYVLNAGDIVTQGSYSFRMAYAQAMSTIASYCAFFKTTPDKIDLRTLQNEIMTYKGRLLPTVDVDFENEKNFQSLQRMFMTGILPLKSNGTNLIFDNEDSVRVADIKPIINRYYSRAQLWFVDNNPEYLTVQDALNLIKFTAFRGEELDMEVKKKWNKELSFEGEFDPSKAISRYKFAVLFELYATPFVKKVSQDGATIYR